MERRVLPRLRALALVLLTSVAFTSAGVSQQQTFVREYTHRASDADSKLSARAVALQEVKRLLLEEVATYVQSTFLSDKREVLVDGRSVSLRALQEQNLMTVTGAVTQTRVLDERWDGKEYWLKAEIRLDPEATRLRLARLALDMERKPSVVAPPRDEHPIRVAPTPPGESPSPSDKPQRVSVHSNQSQTDWTFDLAGCRYASAGSVACDITIISAGKENELTIRFGRDAIGKGYSRSIDDKNGVIAASRITFLRPTGSAAPLILSESRTLRFAADVETPARLSFDGVTRGATVFKRLDVAAGADIIATFQEVLLSGAPAISQAGSTSDDNVAAQTITERNVEFSLAKCERGKTGMVACDFAVTNHGDEGELWIRFLRNQSNFGEWMRKDETRMFDSDRNEYSPSALRFWRPDEPRTSAIVRGTPRVWDETAKHWAVTDIPIAFTIRVDGIPPTIQTLSRLDVSFLVYVPWGFAGGMANEVKGVATFENVAIVPQQAPR